MELEDAFTDQFVSFSSDADNPVDCRDVAKDLIQLKSRRSNYSLKPVVLISL